MRCFSGTSAGAVLLASFALAALSSLMLIALGARANDLSSRVSAQPALYVGKFEPIERAPSGFGPLHALNVDIRRMKADSNAAEAVLKGQGKFGGLYDNAGSTKEGAYLSSSSSAQTPARLM
jgi:hypothetical protein